MKVAIFGNHFQPDKLYQVLGVFDTLRRLKTEFFVCRTFFDFLSSTLMNPPVPDGIIEEGEDFSADFAFSIGGDGTYLRTVHRIGNRNIPILGINTGRLGFLADIDPAVIEGVVMEINRNYYRIVEMSQLHLKVDGAPFDACPCALNEIAVLKRDTSSMINVHTTINNEYVNGYQGDGLLVATPTGSTAYALSVGGPIILPGSKNLLIAPVAPHNLTVRPLVIDDSSVIDLKVESRSKNFLVSLDGHSFTMPCEAKLQIVKAAYSVKAVKRMEHTFIETLRKKLMWGIDPRD